MLDAGCDLILIFYDVMLNIILHSHTQVKNHQQRAV